MDEEKIVSVSSEEKNSELHENFDVDNKTPKIVISKRLIMVASILAAAVLIGILAYYNKGLFIAATIGGESISRLEVIERLEKMSGKNVLDSIITEKLIESEAKTKGVSVSAEEINAEVKSAQDLVAQQGSTLDEALKQQGMTLDDFKTQITLRKDLEKLVGDKISVTDEEVAQYIKDNSVTLPSGQEEQTKSQIKEELTNQKMSNEIGALIDSLKAKANIKYYVNY